jgi:hypothetical protein
MKDNPKLVAAVAAVMNYIKTEEELAIAQAGQTAAAQPSALSAAPAMNLWGINGRQSIMNMRSLMQWKSFHGPRFR